MRNIMWWEYIELLDHLHSRHDIWTESEATRGLWLRTDASGEPLMGLAFIPPAKPGPYRRYGMKVIPMSWAASEADPYAEDLLRYWTSYAYRLDVTTFLVTEVEMPIGKAEAVAIGIVRLGIGPEHDPEKRPVPSQPRLPEFASGFPEPRALAPPVRIWYLAPKGYIAFRPRGGMLSVDISLPEGNGGFNGRGALTGFVRPRNGDLDATFELLYGLREAEPKAPQEEEQHDLV